MEVLKILLLASIILSLIGLYTFKLRNIRSFSKATQNVLSFVAFFIALHCLNIFFSNPHPYLSNTIAAPGTYITRGMLFSSSAYMRRILEPSVLTLILCIIYFYKLSNHTTAKFFLKISIFTSIILLHFEGNFLHEAFSLQPDSKDLHKNLFLEFGWIFVFATIALGFFAQYIKIFSPNEYRKNYVLNISFVFISIGIMFLEINRSEMKKIFKAVHYYVWFPENWKAEYGHKDKNLRAIPTLGEYNSDDPKTISSHLDQIKANDIDIVFIDWWPNQRSLRNRAKYLISQISPDSNIRFALHFETQDITKGNLIIDFSDSNVKKAFKESITYIAKNILNHPNYLRINGKKVVTLYIGRHIVGDTFQVFKEVKETIKKEYDFELFIIGDEVFYNVLNGSNKNDVFLEQKYIPNWSRLLSFDAITLYNPYDPNARYGKDLEEIQSNFILKTEELYNEYKKISEASGIPFIPTVIPAYNDTSIRPDKNHLVIGRNLDGKNTFSELEKISLRVVKPYRSSIISITSWNEWNEGTNIEPSILNQK